VAKSTFGQLSHDHRGTDWLRGTLRGGASLFAVGSLLASAAAFAQDNPATDEDDPSATVEDSGTDGNEIVVSGIRASLANSQNIKRDSDTVVDAITAEDIGNLPDRSVTEALQRVPGVAINRFAGSNDPDHFSVEGSGVVIRGLNFVRGEFNGRDAFSANGGRSLGFSDVPAELLGSVIVAKNVTAEMIEGGLAGTVNLNTRVPFDNYGRRIAFTAEANYSDLAEKWSPNVSGLFSQTWDTPGGSTLGFLISGSYSQVKSRADGLQIPNFQTRDGGTVQGSNNSGDVVRTRIPGFDIVHAPLGGQFRTQEFDRERYGLAAAAQFENADRSFVATLQFIRSDTTNAWGEYTFEAGPDLAEYNTFPAAGTTYQVDEDNVFESGFITLPGSGWRSGASGAADRREPTGGVQNSLARRQVYQETYNQDIGLNLKWSPDDRWSFNFDGQYTKAGTDNLDVSVFGSNFADYEIDLTGNLPQIVAHRPLNTGATWAAPSPLSTMSNEDYFGSQMYTFWRAAMDHIEDSDGDEYAFKGDAQYNFDSGSFLKRAKGGARYSERDQTVRSTTYNWGRLSEVWAQNTGSAVYFDELGGDQTSWYEFNNFFRGEAGGPPGGWYYNGDLIDDYAGSSSFFDSIEEYFREGQPGCVDCEGFSQPRGWRRLSERDNAIAGTPFLPSEIQEVNEKTKAAYIMLSFGNDDYASYPTFSGNVGVRFVRTELDSEGSVQFPQPTAIADGEPYETFCAEGMVDPDGDGPAPPQPRDLPAVCDIGAAAFADAANFADGFATSNLAQHSYNNWLPSLNFKVEANDQVQFRVALARTMARPAFNYTRNFITIGTDTSTGFRFQARAGNPFLLPAKSDQVDVTAEWYFDDVGSLTLNLFHKWVKDFFYDNVTFREFENNGVTQTVAIAGPANYSAERGKIRGFELAYQQTYDFLPGLLSGLGFAGNYTYIDSKGVPNSEIGGIENPGQDSVIQPGNLPLEQLSKHNANATLFYEKGPLSMRASYSWRSKFLLTTRDVIHPFYPVYNDETGQLDASIFFDVNDNIKLAIQGTNLTNEVTKTLQQFTADGMLAPRSYFMNDRRFTFGVRASF